MSQNIPRHPGHACRSLVWMLAAVALLGTGCGGRTTAPPAEPAGATPGAQADPVPSREPAADPVRRLVRETWDTNMIQGDPVGHSHFEEFATEWGGQPVRELVSSNEMSIQRFGQTVTQSIQATSIETPEGQVLRFATTMRTGPSELTIEGVYEDGRMRIETRTLGKTQVSSLEWDRAWGGFFADQLSLQQRPMQPGEQRRIIALVPGTAQTGEIALQAARQESVKLLQEERELLRIESSLNIAGTKINSIQWVDGSGEVLKSSIPGLNHESYRTTREVALRPADKTEFDLGRQTVVKVDRPLPAPHATKRVVYLARLANGSPAETFANGRSQSVRKIDEHTAEITVQAIRPGISGFSDAKIEMPTDADVQPNNLIQSDDGAVTSLAQRFAGGETDPWTLAKIFEEQVRDYVHSKNFSQAISSASDVVRSREGDCTEHAVLLAALCRAQGIPARVAIGLGYYGPVQGFAYHMWNEVWVADGWVPMDATLGMGGIGAGHLKIADSALDTASPMSALLPVIEVIGQLQLEVLSVE